MVRHRVALQLGRAPEGAEGNRDIRILIISESLQLGRAPEGAEGTRGHHAHQHQRRLQLGRAPEGAEGPRSVSQRASRRRFNWAAPRRARRATAKASLSTYTTGRFNWAAPRRARRESTFSLVLRLSWPLQLGRAPEGAEGVPGNAPGLGRDVASTGPRPGGRGG